MTVSGHASESDLERVEQLEGLVSQGNSDERVLLELALLYMEPVHQEDKAIEALEDCLRTNAASWRARIWLAYLYLHHRMDRSALQAAKTLLSPLPDAGETPAAVAFQLLSQVGRASGELDTNGEAALLERSVAHAPEWALNRYLLADCYRLLNRKREALEQLEVAAGNVGSPDPSYSKADREFESAITARTAHGIRMQIDSLRRKILS